MPPFPTHEGPWLSRDGLESSFPSPLRQELDLAKGAVPILVARAAYSDALLRRVSGGTDLWFQVVETPNTQSPYRTLA